MAYRQHEETLAAPHYSPLQLAFLPKHSPRSIVHPMCHTFRLRPERCCSSKIRPHLDYARRYRPTGTPTNVREYFKYVGTYIENVRDAA